MCGRQTAAGKPGRTAVGATDTAAAAGDDVNAARDLTVRQLLGEPFGARSYVFRKASRSALMASAWVVGMPCGKSL
jgi:hypothetical protein